MAASKGSQSQESRFTRDVDVHTARGKLHGFERNTNGPSMALPSLIPNRFPPGCTSDTKALQVSRKKNTNVATTT